MEPTPSQPTSSSPSEAEETSSADAEASPAPLDHDDAVLSDHPRLLAYMRALLTGSVIALIVAVVLFFAWSSGIKGVGRVAVAQSWKRCAPLLVLWIGYGTIPVAVLCSVIAFFPMVTTTVVGLRGLDMRVIETAWLDGAGTWRRLIHVEAPMAAPAVLSGVRGGVVLSMTGAIVGEFVMGGQGLGVLLTQSQQAVDTVGVFTVLVLLAIIASVLVSIMGLAERIANRNLQGEHA